MQLFRGWFCYHTGKYQVQYHWSLTTAIEARIKAESDPTENIHNFNDKMLITFFEVTEVYDLLLVSTEQWSMKLYAFKIPQNSVLLLLFS